jgi:hypothetical protein
MVKTILIRKTYLASRLIFILLLIHFQGFSQKILLLERPGTITNYKYRLDDKIIIKMKGNSAIIQGRISKLTDSSMVIDYMTLVRFREISTVIRPVWVQHWLPALLTEGGAAYLVLTGINDLLTKTYPIIPMDVLLTSGILITAGIGLKYALARVCDLDHKWRLRVLDFDQFSSSAH